MRASGEGDVWQISEAVVLAGGLGTRLRTVVSDVPKPMASVSGRPFLSYLLDFLEGQGIRRVIFSVGYRHEAISGFFGRSYRRLRVDYAIENEPLGTGGGLAQALRMAEQPLLFALNGDTFLKLNYGSMAREASRFSRDFSLGVALRHVDDTARYGRAVLTGGRITEFQTAGASGPGLINAGVYLLPRDLFRRYPVPERFSFESGFFEPRTPELKPLGYVCEEPFIDIGTPESFAAAQTLLPEWTGRVAHS